MWYFWSTTCSDSFNSDLHSFRSSPHLKAIPRMLPGLGFILPLQYSRFISRTAQEFQAPTESPLRPLRNTLHHRPSWNTPLGLFSGHLSNSSQTASVWRKSHLAPVSHVSSAAKCSTGLGEEDCRVPYLASCELSEWPLEVVWSVYHQLGPLSGCRIRHRRLLGWWCRMCAEPAGQNLRKSAVWGIRYVTLMSAGGWIRFTAECNTRGSKLWFADEQLNGRRIRVRRIVAE